MGLLRPLFLFFAFLLVSCARTNYLLDQGIGQFKLLLQGRHNQKVLADPQVPEKDKAKIRLIEEYKSYFYRYWNREAGPIYSKTTFLEQKAVSYLVIASPFNEIKAREECFLLVGCFPYLGFFKKGKAHEYAQTLQKKGFETYIRPVYAYSTLGYFNDRILSSFFHYSDHDLAELVFHELFHTIFFIKGEVDLNENLANYVAEEMALEYFKFDHNQRRKRKNFLTKQKKLSWEVVALAKKLAEEYKKNPPANLQQAQQLRKEFFARSFNPTIKKLCRELKLSSCFPLKRKWNNASLAAFLTYEDKNDKISELRKRLKLKIRPFFQYIEKKYKEYRSGKRKTSFSHYLLERVEK